MGAAKKICKLLNDGEDIDEASDDYSWGLHLTDEYGFYNRKDFNKYLKVQILVALLPLKRALHVHKCKSLYLVGLNKNKPFGIIFF